MGRTIRNVIYFIIGCIIGGLLVFSCHIPQVEAADLRLGVWYDAPHSADSGSSLDPSADVSLALENRWVGISGIYHSRDAQSLTTLVYAKPELRFRTDNVKTDWAVQSISLYPIIGVGLDTHDGGDFAYAIGGGVDVNLVDRWSVGILSQYIERLDGGCYRMKVGMSIKYEF